MEENKTEALQTEDEARKAQPETAAPASPEFSQETLQALAKAVAAYMQPGTQAPGTESQPPQTPAATMPPAPMAPAQVPQTERVLTPEEKRAAEAEQKEELKRKRRKRRIRELRALVIKTAVLLVVIYVLFFKIVGVTVMPNGDMYPRIDSGDLILYYRMDKDVRAQDIIVLKQDGDALRQMMNEREGNAPDMAIRLPGQKGGLLRGLAETLGLVLAENEEMYVCRVVAAEGDTVEITDGGSLLVNGNSMFERNIFYPTTAYTGFVEYPIQLGAGQCFVMADKRDGGADSRFFGPVDKDEIMGTVITIVRRNSL